MQSVENPSWDGLMSSSPVDILKAPRVDRTKLPNLTDIPVLSVHAPMSRSPSTVSVASDSKSASTSWHTQARHFGFGLMPSIRRRTVLGAQGPTPGHAQRLIPAVHTVRDCEGGRAAPVKG